MNIQKNKLVIIGIVVTLLVLVVGGFVYVSTSKKAATGLDEFENEEVIQPVDASVKVELIVAPSRQEVTVVIKNAPQGTKTADIELSYDAQSEENPSISVPQGALSTCEFTGGRRDCTKEKITLGTCSSGACRYHKVTGNIKLSVLFSGSYGERIFEKEYELD